MNMGNKIKEARQRLGISQKELADKLGTSPQNLAQYENGKRNPKIDTLKKIASALDVSVYSLIDPVVLQLGEDVIDLFTGEHNIELINDYTKINHLYDQLNRPGQDKAIEQVELLTKIPEYQKKSDK